MTAYVDAAVRRDAIRVVVPMRDEPDHEIPRLPVWQIIGLLGSGAFAVWTGLTCFVC